MLLHGSKKRLSGAFSFSISEGTKTGKPAAVGMGPRRRAGGKS